MKINTPTAEELCALITEQTALIAHAAEKAHENELVDIGDLNRNIDAICGHAAALEPDEAHKIEADMAAMIGKLEELGAALVEFKKRAAAQDERH